MLVLYNIAMRLYACVIFLAQPFSRKAKLWIQGRYKIWNKLEKDFSSNKEKVIWIHVSSLGEFEQGRPIIERIKERYPYKIFLTFFSPSGYEQRKDYHLADYVYYLSVDTAKNASRLLDIVKPSLVYFVKYDYWYHYLKEVNKRQIPLFLISAIFRDNQIFFKYYGHFYRRILSFFSQIFVQELHSKEMLNSIGFDGIITGDTRIDRVIDIADKANRIIEIEQFKQNKKIIIAGSTWEKDEDLLLKYLQEHSFKDFKLIIAPHEVHEKHIKQIRDKFSKYSVIKYSQQPSEKSLAESRILIIDTIGLLSSLYQYGDIAYIGGGFGAGIHNTLEPATFALPIIFGKKYKKFHEALTLLKRGGAFSVENYPQFEKILTTLLENTDKRTKAGEISREFININKGATKLVIKNTLF